MIWFPTGVFALLIILGLTFVPAPKRSESLALSCVLTLLTAFLVSFLYSFIKNSIPLTDDTRRILIHYLVHDHIFFYFPGIVISFLCLLFTRKDATPASVRASGFVLMCFFMGFAMLATFFYSQHGWWADPYFLFYLTGLRVFQALAFALLAPLILFKKYGVFALPALLGILIIPFATGLVSYLYYTSRLFPA